MPERNLAIRLSVMEGGKVKAELKEIGESGDRCAEHRAEEEERKRRTPSDMHGNHRERVHTEERADIDENRRERAPESDDSVVLLLLRVERIDRGRRRRPVTGEPFDCAGRLRFRIAGTGDRFAVRKDLVHGGERRGEIRFVERLLLFDERFERRKNITAAHFESRRFDRQTHKTVGRQCDRLRERRFGEHARQYVAFGDDALGNGLCR